MDNSAKVKISKTNISLIGEYYTLWKLAKEGIRSYKLQDMFDFDIMTISNIKIEVKTATRIEKKDQFTKKDGSRTSRTGWLFMNFKSDPEHINGIIKPKFIQRLRSCDFYVMICLDNENDILKTFVIPIYRITRKGLAQATLLAKNYLGKKGDAEFLYIKE